MSDSGAKINRARRNALKAAGVVFGAMAASGASKPASAQSIADWLRDLFGGPSGIRSFGGGGSSGSGGSSKTGGGNCFARGTLVRTREGFRPIETLKAGDEVAVRFQGFAKIKAMVSHTLECELGRWDGTSNVPVVVRRGALGENSPSTDLCLTDLHPLYVDGFLVKAGDLVNGISISFKAADGDPLDLFNIELDRHDVLDVQGAPCESLYRAGAERCAPLLGFDGRRSELRSRLRSMASIVRDRRQPLDIIRDTLEDRADAFARAA